MLSTRFLDLLPSLRAAALVAAMAVLAACAARAARPAATTASRSTPASRSRWRCCVPYGSGDPGREQIARSLENAARLAQARPAQRHDRPRGLSRPPAPPTAARPPPSQAVAEGAKIIVGPLFSTETAGAQPVGGLGRAERAELQQQPSVAGSNVYILGTSFENTADRLVAYGLSHGLRQLRRRLSGRARGRDRARRRDARRSASAARRWPAPQPYNLSVEGIQAAAGPVAAALNARRRQRGDPDRRADRRARLHLRGAARQRRQRRPGAVHGHAALGRLGRGAGGAEPAGRRLRRAGPGPGRRLRRPLPDRLRRERRTSSPGSPTTASPRSAR